MEPGFSIRPLSPDSPEDLARILEVERKVHVAPWTEENFRSEFAKPYSQTLVLTDDETDSIVAGYIVFWIMFDECRILDVAVDLPYRGLGFGKALVRQAVNLAQKKDAKRVELEVRKSNLAAVQLYQSLKFVITHVRKGFYSNGEDAYQMALYFQDDGIEF